MHVPYRRHTACAALPRGEDRDCLVDAIRRSTALFALYCPIAISRQYGLDLRRVDCMVVVL